MVAHLSGCRATLEVRLGLMEDSYLTHSRYRSSDANAPNVSSVRPSSDFHPPNGQHHPQHRSHSSSGKYSALPFGADAFTWSESMTAFCFIAWLLGRSKLLINRTSPQCHPHHSTLQTKTSRCHLKPALTCRFRTVPRQVREKGAWQSISLDAHE